MADLLTLATGLLFIGIGLLTRWLTHHWWLTPDKPTEGAHKEAA